MARAHLPAVLCARGGEHRPQLDLGPKRNSPRPFRGFGPSHTPHDLERPSARSPRGLDLGSLNSTLNLDLDLDLELDHLHCHTLPAVFLFSKIRPIDK